MSYVDPPLLHDKECLTRSDQEQELSPGDDENKAEYTAQKQGKQIPFLSLPWQNTKPNESNHFRPNHHPTAIDASDKIVEAVANSTIDNTIAKLIDPSSRVEGTTCLSFPPRKYHHHFHTPTTTPLITSSLGTKMKTIKMSHSMSISKYLCEHLPSRSPPT